MILMVLCFATMNYTFVASLTLTSAANSIFLQYTAPLWMTLASYLLLGEGVDRRTVVAITGCLAGVAIIVVGNREASSHEQWGLLLGLAAGFFYAGVAVSLRYLREHDPRWLAFLNHFVAGTSLLLVNGIGYGMGTISGEVFALPNEPIKMAALLLFGILQMGLPYVLFARGLASITAQEAGILTLIEPVLTPIWAFLMAGDLPTGPTLLGGIVLLAALAVRYIPIGGRTISKSNGKEHADVPPQDP
jgi:drug/metabolite transporter (DMT)-like permease